MASKIVCAHPDNRQSWHDMRREHATIWCSDCGALRSNGGDWKIPRLYQEKEEKK